MKTESNKVQKIIVDNDHTGQRLDNFLLNFLKGIPKSKIYSIIRKGEVRVNSLRKKAFYKIAKDDLIRIPPLNLPIRSDKVPSIVGAVTVTTDLVLLLRVFKSPALIVSTSCTPVALAFSGDCLATVVVQLFTVSVVSVGPAVATINEIVADAVPLDADPPSLARAMVIISSAVYVCPGLVTSTVGVPSDAIVTLKVALLLEAADDV